MSTEKKPFEIDFQRESQKIFKNNVSDYNTNDISFLRRLNNLYGDALNAKGLNVADPFEANMFHYNKLGFKGNIDQPRVTKTYVFFTRPELNFSFENISSVPFFKWLYAQDIGKMIMASLTDPEYFINAPTAFNAASFNGGKAFTDALQKFNTLMKDSEKEMADTSRPPKSTTDDGYAKYGLNSSNGQDFSGLTDDSEDDSEDVENLQAINLDAIGMDENALQILASNSGALQSTYTKFYASATATLATSMAYANGRDENGTNNKYIRTLRENNLFQAKTSIFGGDDYLNTTPFIPLLSNIVTSLDCAKDFQLDLYNYEEDEHGTSLSVATGMDSVWKEGEFTTSIEDITYSPGSLLFMVWLLYIHYVSRGYIMPTREHITERILDYTCSAYVFVIGEDGRRIERFGKFTGCFPTSFPLSQQLIHNNQIDPDMLHKFSVNWHFNRYTPMDPQIFTDFNFISQTEWLIKLKDPLWENLYTRGSEKNLGSNIYDTTTTTEKQIIEKSFNRPSGLWDLVKKPGMSGKLPPSLYPDSRHPNNFWGGYPFIYKGREFLWVQPSYTTNLDLSAEVSPEVKKA